jgi:hypothetical protein
MDRSSGTFLFCNSSSFFWLNVARALLHRLGVISILSILIYTPYWKKVRKSMRFLCACIKTYKSEKVPKYGEGKCLQ